MRHSPVTSGRHSGGHATRNFLMLPDCLSLRFASEIQEPVRSRMLYAFQVFAAIYDYRVVDADSGVDSLCCVYGAGNTWQRGNRTFPIPARYRTAKPGQVSSKAVKHRYGGEDICLFHDLDVASGNPDWLGELFEWLSSSHEMQATGRDSSGRIPYSESV